MLQDGMTEDFKTYVKKYATKHQITEEEALKHEMVRLVRQYYDSKKGENS